MDGALLQGSRTGPGKECHVQWEKFLASRMGRVKGVTWTRPEGGMFIWLTLPPGMDGAEVLARSPETARVAFVPGRAFFADVSGGNTLRLSFSCASEAQIDAGIRRLGTLIGQD